MLKVESVGLRSCAKGSKQASTLPVRDVDDVLWTGPAFLGARTCSKRVLRTLCQLVPPTRRATRPHRCVPPRLYSQPVRRNTHGWLRGLPPRATGTSITTTRSPNHYAFKSTSLVPEALPRLGGHALGRD